MRKNYCSYSGDIFIRICPLLFGCRVGDFVLVILGDFELDLLEDIVLDLLGDVVFPFGIPASFASALDAGIALSKLSLFV